MDSTTSSTVEPENMYDYINGFLMNPVAFIILIVVIIAYLILFLSLGKSSEYSYSETTSNSGYDTSSNMLFVIILGIIIVLVLFNGIQYFFSIDIIASIKNLFVGGSQIDITVNQPIIETPQKMQRRQQVFNIPGNYYGYEDAKTLCQAYDSRLATYDEVESSYNDGGEWCNYGWSDKQMALFPTQKNTFDNLQTIPGHEHDCGRTGVNGGYIANPHVKFGVNCYGHKPKITTEEEEMMQNTSPYPKTEKDIVMENRVDYWKTKIDEILVSPFNYESWSRI